MVNFPAPIGGTVLPFDFAPSILFATLYGLLVPLNLYRLFDRRSRTTLLIGTVAFSIERIVIFSLRATQSHNEKRSLSPGLATYMQISFGLGYIGIANDMVNLLRCLLLNPTHGSERYPESPAGYTKGGEMCPPPEGTEDHPKTRFWVRRYTDFLGLAFLSATVPGIIANSHYNQVFSDQAKADSAGRNRIVSTAVALALTIILLGSIWWGRWKLPRMSRKGAMVLTLVCVCLTTISIYRLPNLIYYTTSLSAPSPLNTPRSKAAFYILHVLPEWLATLILFGFNVRKTLGTGLCGDWRFRDETPKEKVRRLKRLAGRAEKKQKQLEGGKVGGETEDLSLQQRDIPLVEKV